MRTVGTDRTDWLWFARIRDDQGNQRTMTAPSCDELARAVAMVVAMADRGLTPAVRRRWTRPPIQRRRSTPPRRGSRTRIAAGSPTPPG